MPMASIPAMVFSSTGKGLKAPHGLERLLESGMVGFNRVVENLTSPVLHVFRQNPLFFKLVYCGWIGGMLIGIELFGLGITGLLQGFFEKALGGLFILFRGQEEI